MNPAWVFVQCDATVCEMADLPAVEVFCGFGEAWVEDDVSIRLNLLDRFLHFLLSCLVCPLGR